MYLQPSIFPCKDESLDLDDLYLGDPHQGQHLLGLHRFGQLESFVPFFPDKYENKYFFMFLQRKLFQVNAIRAFTTSDEDITVQQVLPFLRENWQFFRAISCGDFHQHVSFSWGKIFKISLSLFILMFRISLVGSLGNSSGNFCLSRFQGNSRSNSIFKGNPGGNFSEGNSRGNIHLCFQRQFLWIFFWR